MYIHLHIYIYINIYLYIYTYILHIYIYIYITLSQVIRIASHSNQVLRVKLWCASRELWNHIVQMQWKSGCTSVLYNDVASKEFRLCNYRALKSSCTIGVKIRLCYCNVEWHCRQMVQVYVNMFCFFKLTLTLINL